jgi:Ca2+-binding RTX toxin-like protein
MAKIIGTPGDEILTGTLSNDRFIGSAGNDIILGRKGIDIVDYSSLGQAVSIGVAGTINKGSLGTDTVQSIETIIGATGLSNSIDGSTASLDVSLVANLSQNSLVVSGIPNLQPLTFTVKNFVDVFGASGNDIIIGNQQNNNFQGGDGNDTFVGSAGKDAIFGGEGIDIVDYSSLGQAVSIGVAGTINKGSLGTDTVQSIETIIGATGLSNSIDGSTASLDVSLVANLSQNSLVVSGIPNLQPLTFTVKNFVDVFGTSEDDTIIGNDLSNSLLGGNGNDIIRGNDGTDFLFGEGGNDFLDGGSGTDFLSGGAKDDILIGNLANDVIDGGDGNDLIVGGDAADVLTGGADFDKFQYFTPTEGGDLIKDFTVGEDKITILASGFGGGLSVGTLSSSRFVLGTAALDADDRFIYNNRTGLLFFDQDGNAGFTQQLLATLTNLPALSANSIVIV